MTFDEWIKEQPEGVAACDHVTFGRMVWEAARTKWFPIETAPKDGTEILVMHVCIETQIVHNAFWIEDEDDEKETGWWSYEHSEVSRIKLDDWLTPTHWMPLPSATD